MMSFRELAHAARRQAGVLRSQGLVPGDRVTLIPEQQSFVITFLAALVAQLVPVPVYPPASLAKLGSWRQTAEGIVRAASSAAIITSDELCPLLWSVGSHAGAKIITWQQLDSSPAAEFASQHADPGDLAFLRPVAYLDTLAFLKRPALWFELIHRHRGTITFAPPFAYALAVRRIPCSEVTRWDLSCLRVAGCGAEPIAGRTLRAFSTHFEAAGLRPEALCPSYGLAEANASGHLHARG